jgi:hypothetical protein
MLEADYPGSGRDRLKQAARQLGFFLRRAGEAPSDILTDIKVTLGEDAELIESFLEGAIQADIQKKEA